MKTRTLLVLGAFIFAAIQPPLYAADVSYQGIFCTLTSGNGFFYTVHLRVPRDGGGPCEVNDLQPSIVSGPVPAPGPSTPMIIEERIPKGSFRQMIVGKSGLSPAAAELAFVKLKAIGNLATRDSHTYSNCRLVAFQVDGVIVLHDSGLSKIMFQDLDAPSRARVDAAR